MIEILIKLAEKLGKVKSDLVPLEEQLDSLSIIDSLEKTYLEGYMDAMEIAIKLIKKEIDKRGNASDIKII